MGSSMPKSFTGPINLSWSCRMIRKTKMTVTLISLKTLIGHFDNFYPLPNSTLLTDPVKSTLTTIRSIHPRMIRETFLRPSFTHKQRLGWHDMMRRLHVSPKPCNSNSRIVQ